MNIIKYEIFYLKNLIFKVKIITYRIFISKQILIFGYFMNGSNNMEICKNWAFLYM